MSKKRSPAADSDAVFVGWQQLVTGSPIALYNVIAAGNPCYGSTVSEQKLNELNLKIPKQPSSNAKKSRSYSEKRE
jgi:hypothetical protein